MKMRIKKYFLLCFLPVIAVLCFVLLAPAFADMKKVDEAELAQMNASVTGESVKDQSAGVEKGVVIPEKCQACGTDTGDAVLSPSVSMETNIVSMNIKNQETLKFYFGGSRTDVTGGIWVKPR